ncbi:hypothetical protein Tco_1538760 [Tanacetum coccineum]
MRVRGEFSIWCRKISKVYSRGCTWDVDVEATLMEITPGPPLRGVVQRVDRALITTVRQRTEEFQYREAVYARVAWTSSEERSAAIEAHVRTLEVQVATLIAQTTSLQTQLTTALGRVAAALADMNASRSRVGDNRPWFRSAIAEEGNCGQDVAYTMPWTALKRMITDKYCPRGEIKKLESEYWNLKVRAKCEKDIVGGLPDLIHGSVKASKPQSMQEALEFATEMMDKKMLTAAERQAENKRKFEDTSRNNNPTTNHSKKQCGMGLTLLGREIKKPYGGTKTSMLKI